MSEAEERQSQQGDARDDDLFEPRGPDSKRKLLNYYMYALVKNERDYEHRKAQLLAKSVGLLEELGVPEPAVRKARKASSKAKASSKPKTPGSKRGRPRKRERELADDEEMMDLFKLTLNMSDRVKENNITTWDELQDACADMCDTDQLRKVAKIVQKQLGIDFGLD